MLYISAFSSTSNPSSSSKGSSDRSSRGTRSVLADVRNLTGASTRVRERLLAEYADRLGLNVPQFLRDIARGTYLDRINQDIESGIRSGVTQAPALFINGTRYRNALEIEPLLAAIVESGNFS